MVCAVTGASGYVGSRLAEALSRNGTVVPLGRKAGHNGIPWTFGTPVAKELKARNIDALVHSAWDFRDTKADLQGSRQLLQDAKSAGVQRIVFISTISAFEAARSEYGKSKLAVERMVLEAGGTVIRPGLVWGNRPGGMFGSLRQQVSKGRSVPVIGDGRFPQFLVHEDDLAEAVVRAAQGEFGPRVLTVANPRIWLLRDLILRMAAEEGKTVRLVEIPWRLIYTGLKTAELLGLKLSFRSDSVVSLVYQDPAPQFSGEIQVRELV